ncbi:uncharacterized protein LOC115748635 [Rhodamnia argentea]|uniref:Uncharacterized protein LOC115748635 n=1 Tax=Rhodamnia argentea TaxID=178133 RepID=A0A8B8Q1T0_9MYRT|nr:uncharacterized protein LOC115748635 [Rhodamnia argentea]
MAVLTDSPFPFLATPAASSAASLFVPKFSISSWNRSARRTFRIPSSRISRAPSPPLRLPFSNARPLPVAALSGRRAKRRRNRLREKLFHDQKVRPDFARFDPQSDAQAPSFDGILENDVFIESGSRKDVPFDRGGEVAGLVESKRRVLGESVMWSRLENWVDQYKNDLDLWGVGSAPIFTVFQDPDGKVKRVTVDEGEILRRSRGVLPEHRDSIEVNSKIARAKGLAMEMESGGNVILRNSSVAKFVTTDAESGFVSTLRNQPFHSALRPKVLGAGTMVLCGVFVFCAIKWFSSFRKREVRYTQLEKEMMRRKMKARNEKEMLEKGHLEVFRDASETPVNFMRRPHLDKHALASSIRQAKTSSSELAEPKQDPFTPVYGLAVGFDGKIEEIRELAKRARETEGRESSLTEGCEGEKQGQESLSTTKEFKQRDEDAASSPVKYHAHTGGSMPANESHVISTPEPESDWDASHSESLAERNGDIRASSVSAMGDHSDIGSCRQDKATECISDLSNAREIQSLDALDGEAHRGNAVRRKPKIIRSVKEAREYLFDKPGTREGNENFKEEDMGESEINSNLRETTNIGEQSASVGMSGGTPNSMVNANFHGDMTAKELEYIPEMVDNLLRHGEVNRAYDSSNPPTCQKHESNGLTAEADTSEKSQNWMEENFNVVEPVLEKIGDGFRNNYMTAREKVNQQLNVGIDSTQLCLDGDTGELEWMKDDSLREIVFQVRDNELTGKDPFYSMDAEDKRAFFAGLEKKVEKVNEELLKVHEYLHSNIENLDYGADGVSIYDSLEKIIPRWKGPPVGKPNYVNRHLEEKKASMTGEAQVSHLMKKDEENLVEKSAGNGDNTSSLAVNSVNNIQSKDLKKTKILIEGSDGSVRTGKKLGKEYWQHTKKWSRGFLESYSAERDPEVKSVMKDIGKDLDRWITEKEIEEAAELMDKLPETNKEYIGKKLNKLKREMELFGPQAVVSKYQEYAEHKDEDYLWWLDLPHVLCIELYTHHNGEQKVGFYSLEMAADLELEPKPHHVIAFEDAGDCKNLCYIVQAHMDMLGTGQAFIVPLPPKDAFREAKANGFGVTVIRKGEVQLNVDQLLEEVEEQITEIGSKIYHDKIMQERSVDIGALMKGVFGVNSKPTKRRRLKRARKKPSRPRKTKRTAFPTDES